ncbi:hypothetical protein CsSME_00021651 [Camellia sinensis var. sinensis]
MWDKKSSCLKIIADNGQEYGKKNPIRVLYHGYGHYDVLQSPSDDPYLKLEDLDLSFINVSHELDETSKGYVCFITFHELFCNLCRGYLHLCHEFLDFRKHGVIVYAKVVRSKNLKPTRSAIRHVDVHVHATGSQQCRV